MTWWTWALVAVFPYCAMGTLVYRRLLYLGREAGWEDPTFAAGSFAFLLLPVGLCLALFGVTESKPRRVRRAERKANELRAERDALEEIRRLEAEIDEIKRHA
jgi:hypothetical protein